MKTLIAFFLMTYTAQAVLLITGGSFKPTEPNAGYSILSTAIAPGDWQNYRLSGVPEGDVIVSLKINGYWSDPAGGWTGAEELHYGIGDLMQVRVPTNADSIAGITVSAIALLSVKADYAGELDQINQDPTVLAFLAGETGGFVRPRVGNSSHEATVGVGHPDGSITCDFDADFGEPQSITIPEPNTVALVLLGGLFLFRRR